MKAHPDSSPIFLMERIDGTAHAVNRARQKSISISLEDRRVPQCSYQMVRRFAWPRNTGSADAKV
jgi:hypothetical protein